MSSVVTIDLISSRQNPLIKEAQSIRDDRQSPFLFLEGPHLIQEALTSGLSIETLWMEKSFATLPEQALENASRVLHVTPQVFAALSDVDAPQGVIAVVRRPTWGWPDLIKRSPAPIVILDGLQDPGNTATIVRTAEAAGAAGVVTTRGTAHLMSPKALRSASGSTMRLPSIEHQTVDAIVSALGLSSYFLLAATQTGTPYTAVDWKQPRAIIFGREGQGLSVEWTAHEPHAIQIPMKAPVESLNVAASAAVLLYEAHRQREDL